jgi:rSAM/selenodomain-associated transferase 1
MEDDAGRWSIRAMSSRVVVLTRVPQPGLVKTRLIPSIGAAGACRVHAAMVAQTLRRVAQSGLALTVSVAGPMDDPFVRDLIGRGIEVEAQVNGDLGARLRHALRRPGAQIALGTDCPCFGPEDLTAAAESDHALSIGPTIDGGYWLIKVDGEPVRSAVFRDIPWSTSAVCRTTESRAHSAGLSIHWLPTRYDVDEPSDLQRLFADPDWEGPHASSEDRLEIGRP